MAPIRSTLLTETLGLGAPVLQSGMGGVAGPELAAAVSNAGGLGILAALNLSPDRIRTLIGQVRELTDRPFGVNLWLHDDVRRPPGPDALTADAVRGSQAVLNGLRPRFDLPTTLAAPGPLPDLIGTALEVLVAERIPVFSAGLGIPEPALVERFHSVGTRVVAMVATVADAVAAADNGVDVVVAQGAEAGGHRSHGAKLAREAALGSSVVTLVPEVVDALVGRGGGRGGGRVPVAAAGGVVDGRGLAAMLALGADGVLLGTRFVVTRESTASARWKARLLSPEPVETVLSDGFTGQWARMLRSEFTDHWVAGGAVPPPGLAQAALAADLTAAARAVDDDQMLPFYAGTGAALISDLPGAADVVERLVAEAEAALARVSSG